MSTLHTIANDFMKKRKKARTGTRVDFGMIVTDKTTRSKKSIKIFNVKNDISKFRNLLRQLLVLKHLKHFNIANVDEGLLTQNVLFLERDHLDYNLQQVLLERGSGLSDDHIKYIFYQLVLSIAYLHFQKIEHLNLSPECVLLTNNCDVKLSGFEEANPQFLPKPKEAKSVYQTYYVAPELILNNGQNAHCLYKADIWALGCIFFELLERKHVLGFKRPFLDQLKWEFKLLGSPLETRWIKNNEAKKWVTGLRPQQKKFASSYLGPRNSCKNTRDLLDRMLQINPHERADALSLLRHSYFSDIFHENDVQFYKSKIDSNEFLPCHPNNEDFSSMRKALSKMSIF